MPDEPKSIDDYSLQELVEAVRRKREKGEVLKRGAPIKPKACRWCQTPIPAKDRQRHEPRCEKNPNRQMLGSLDNLRPRGGKLMRQQSILKRSRDYLGIYDLEVQYSNDTDTWTVIQKSSGRKWTIDKNYKFGNYKFTLIPEAPEK
jgi:hypothetical protein